jgi:hypothetical protein
MDHQRTPLSRRAFLRLAAAGLGAYSLPDTWAEPPVHPEEWPRLHLDDLPEYLSGILSHVPRARVGREGYLDLLDSRGEAAGRAQLARTLWNKEHSHPYDRLNASVPWGIVLHWYGDRETFDQSIPGYLRGFDDLRLVAGEYLRTSAHFLVGEGEVRPYSIYPNRDIGILQTVSILQTQAPDKDGTPFVASHLQRLDYYAHRARQQYFVRALYQLGYADPGVHSMLQDLFDGRPVDANMRTLAVEISGYDFENPDHFPSEQKLANTLSLVWALMERYNVLAINLLGHHEIQLNKADPGKKFMALVRFLVGVKALVDRDPGMVERVFCPFLSAGRNPEEAVRAYFKFVRDYLALTSPPKTVYEWESASGYWFVADRLPGQAAGPVAARELRLPLSGMISQKGFVFLDPHNHEGVDLYRDRAGQEPEPVLLSAGGVCLFAGRARGACGWGDPGLAAIFRHRQPDGAEFLTVSSHLSELGDLRAGNAYPAGYRLGATACEPYRPEGYLHYAVAYGATWDTDLRQRPTIPLNAGETWIRQRYMKPETFLAGQPVQVERRWKG